MTPSPARPSSSSPEDRVEASREFGGPALFCGDEAVLSPRPLGGDGLDLRERVTRKKRADEILKGLPSLNCGLCGAPSCKHHAEDVTASRANLSDCVFLSRDRIYHLREIYRKA